MNQIGYACINMELSQQKPKIYTGRSMINRTFEQRGIEYASQLGLDNTKDLEGYTGEIIISKEVLGL